MVGNKCTRSEYNRCNEKAKAFKISSKFIVHFELNFPNFLLIQTISGNRRMK